MKDAIKPFLEPSSLNDASVHVCMGQAMGCTSCGWTPSISVPLNGGYWNNVTCPGDGLEGSVLEVTKNTTTISKAYWVCEVLAHGEG